MRNSNLISFVLLLGIGSAATAQENKAYILERTNVAELQRLSEKWGREYEVKHAEALRVALERGWPLEGLQYMDEKGLPVYYTADNQEASAMTKTTQLRDDLGVQGNGMVIDEWDAGHGLSSHQDLTGRVTIMDSPVNIQDHATHVAGTLIGSGYGEPDAKGMAPLAALRSYDFYNDVSEVSTAAAAGTLVSNHSYGQAGGWKNEGLLPSLCFPFVTESWTWLGDVNQFVAGGDDDDFGQYDTYARDFDTVCVNAPFYLPVLSAGNYNSSDPGFNSTPTCSDFVRYTHADGTYSGYQFYNPFTQPPGNSIQRSTMASFKNAKNVLTIGNLQEDEVIHESSSRGMTDDGRIKPDLCGNGTDVYSTESSANDDYGEKTGTSMAAPNVAGSLLLLQQLYEERNGNNGTYMRSATLKGLAIHTAKDLGNPGPDFTYGWGLLNAKKAGDVIVTASYEFDHRIIEVSNPNGYSFTFFKDGPIRITLCYTDQGGTATSVHNDPTPKLKNDLDLTLVKTGGPTYYPYVMNFNNPSANATTGDNDRDNVEQIYAPDATNGEYTVHVNVEGTLTGTQPFSLIISGVNDGCGAGGEVDLGNNIVEPEIYYGNNITCEGTVQSGATVKFVASISVFLREDNGSGFHAEAGSNFKAVALQCE